MSLSFHLWHHHPCPVPHLFEKNTTAWQSAQKCVFRFLLRSWASPFIWNPGKNDMDGKGRSPWAYKKKLGSNHSFFHVSKKNYLWISYLCMQAWQASTSKQYWIFTYFSWWWCKSNGPTLYESVHKHRAAGSNINKPPHKNPFIGDFPFSSFSRLIGLEGNTLQERPEKMMGKTW